MNKAKLARQYVDIVKRINEVQRELSGLKQKERELEDGFKTECTGYGSTYDGEGGYMWATYPADFKDIEIKDDWAALGRDWLRYYSGPGQYFTHAPWITRSKGRALVRQFHGLDI